MLINKAIPVKYIFLFAWKEIVGAIVVAGAISYFDQYFEGWGLKFPIIEMSVPQMLGTMITLILAFRMGQSYDRWWEARKEWGAIVNESRGFMREVAFLAAKGTATEESIKFRDEMVKLLLAWNYELVSALRKTTIEHNYLTEEERARLLAIDGNLPAVILHEMQFKVQEAYNTGLINEYQQIQISNTINELGISMGKCERIKNTVFPKMYSDLIDFIIWIFIIIFPIAFRDPNEYVEFPVVVIISMIFVMLEKLAEALQDPFENRPTDTPILDIARKIEIMGLGVMGVQDRPSKIEVEKGFYLM